MQRLDAERERAGQFRIGLAEVPLKLSGTSAKC
jgi:hypothetical protein